LSGSKKTVIPYNIRNYGMLGSGGFEPSKAEPTDLQNPKYYPFNFIETILAPKQQKSQGFWVFLLI
jgi:hypothetical protein